MSSKPRLRKKDVPMQAIAHIHTRAQSSPYTSIEGASIVEAMATSMRAALAATPHCHTCRKETALKTPAPAIPPIHFVNDSFFFMELVYCVSLTDCLLIPDCPYLYISDYATNSPMPLRLHQTCFLSVRCPHQLIITLSFTTICVVTLPCVLLSHFRLMPILLPI